MGTVPPGRHPYRLFIRLPRTGRGQEQQVQSFGSERPTCYLLSGHPHPTPVPTPRYSLFSWAGEAPGSSLPVSPFLEGWAVWQGLSFLFRRSTREAGCVAGPQSCAGAWHGSSRS